MNTTDLGSLHSEALARSFAIVSRAVHYNKLLTDYGILVY